MHEKWSKLGSLVITYSQHFCWIQIRQKNDLDLKRPRFFNKNTCGTWVIPSSALTKIATSWWKKSKVKHPTCKKPKNINRKTYQPIILGVLPIFHSVNADFAPKCRLFPSDLCFSNLFKSTKTDTILYGWPLPSKVDSEYGADSDAPTIGFSRPIQILQTVRWCKLMNPSVRNGFEISTYLTYVIFTVYQENLRKPLTDWSCSIFVIIFWNTNRCSRVHAPAAPCRGLTYRRNRTECVVWVNGTFVHFRAFVATPNRKSIVFFPHQTGPWQLAPMARS